MKRKFVWGIVSLVLFAIGILGVKIHQRVVLNRKVSEKIQTIPTLIVYSFQNKKEDISTMVRRRPLVLIYFNTDCHYCQGEVESITHHSKLMQLADIVLVSDQPLKKLVEFNQDYNLSSFSHMQIFCDRDHQFYHVFGTDIHPNTYIYGEDGRLLKHFKGETSAEAMMRILKN